MIDEVILNFLLLSYFLAEGVGRGREEGRVVPELLKEDWAAACTR